MDPSLSMHRCFSCWQRTMRSKGGQALVPSWDKRYELPGFLFGEQPNAFLKSQQGLLKPGWHALSLADGEGRNGIWLAEQGLHVHALDASPVALRKARTLARKRGVALRFEHADLLDWNWPEAAYDLVVAIFIQFAGPEGRKSMFDGLRRALKPGGLLILQGYTPRQLEYKTGGPPAAENMYTQSLLSEAFGDWTITHLQEHDDFIAEGSGHYGQSALIDLVATKPLGASD
jgi:cyclopropane fatty-acyl-phospholipid synthase-like methyltransferase